MSDDERGDVCGAECVDGSPCQNPAGSCSVPSHSDPDAENPDGRPTVFTDERARQAIEAARIGKSKAGCERDMGVGEGTLSNWLDMEGLTFTDADGNEQEFFRAFRRARGEGESGWIEEGRDPDGDSSFAKFMLSSSYDYKTKSEVDASHEHSGNAALNVTVRREAATTDDITDPDE